MKLCIVMPAHWSARIGGAEIQVRYLLDYLRRTTSHEISFVCRRTSLLNDNGIRIHTIGTPARLARYSYIPDYPSVQYLLRRLDPDVVYTRIGTPLVGFVAHYCTKFGKRHVHHIARLDDVLSRRCVPFRSKIERLERRIYEYGLRSATAVIAQAAYQKLLLQKHFARSDAEVIANYHPLPSFAEQKDDLVRTVLWVANIKAPKRPELFVKLAERCSDVAELRFVMVGEMRDRRYEPLLSQAARLPNFTYMGALPFDAVNKLLASAHLFVNTSTAMGEGFPNTFIQAWLQGAPVISLDVNPDNLLDNGRLGLCCNGAFEQLVERVTSILADKDRLRRMALDCRQHASDSYGETNLQRIRSVLEDSVSGPSP